MAPTWLPYTKRQELEQLLHSLCGHFASVYLLMDCYTEFGAKASKYKNPIQSVGVKQVYGLDQPCGIEKSTGLKFIKEYDMTPQEKIQELEGLERIFFQRMFGGSVAKKMYRLFAYESGNIYSEGL